MRFNSIVSKKSMSIKTWHGAKSKWGYKYGRRLINQKLVQVGPIELDFTCDLCVK